MNLDFSNGSAFIQDGVLYYSPNSSRPILVPERGKSVSPFEGSRLSVSSYRQPVWWTESQAWLGFVPLNPSFTSLPFQSFAWAPRIEEVDVSTPLPPTPFDANPYKIEKRYRMSLETAAEWKRREDQLVRAAHVLSLGAGIQATKPPPPSHFNYMALHKSPGVAKKMASLARDWLMMWMGLLSYLIPESERRSGKKDDHLLPAWHRLLLDKEFSSTWIDGLTSSPVGTFDARTARCGLIIPWSEVEAKRPPIAWFLRHHIPVWFVWTAKEEDAISTDTSLMYLRPPDSLLKRAFDAHFCHATIPVASLIIKRFYNVPDENLDGVAHKFLQLERPASFVFHVLVNKLLQEHKHKLSVPDREKLARLADWDAERRLLASQAAAELPQEDMMEVDEEEKGRPFSHWHDFFDARDKRHEEMMKVESAEERCKREARAQNPSMKKAAVYVWQTSTSRSGRVVYLRVRVNSREKENIFAQYSVSERRFNAFDNEWDFCEEFPGPKDVVEEEDDDDGSVFDGDSLWNDGVVDVASHVDEERLTLTRVVEEGPTEEEENIELLEFDLYVELKLAYGYVRPLAPRNFEIDASKWEKELTYVGILDSMVPSVSLDDKRAILKFFSGSMDTIPSELDDLNANNFKALALYYNFKYVENCGDDLFVFSFPRSASCDWVLGVHSAAAALYVCRTFAENPLHTIATVARRMLEKCIPFRTLLAYPYSPHPRMLHVPFDPTPMREDSYIFTPADFDAAMVQCRNVLMTSQGRAALLYGGIVSRIAKEFLSIDGALDGPSIEVKHYRLGYQKRSTKLVGSTYWDDELTENELAVICGTYRIYTGRGQQTATVSWFPPVKSWYADKNGRGGFLAWTPYVENWFLALMSDIRDGKSQPRTQKVWRSRLMGDAKARAIGAKNSQRAGAFVNKYVR